MAFLPLLARPRLRTALTLAALMLGLGPSPLPAWAAEGPRTYRVVNVDYDDVLNVRAGPSMGYPVVGEIPPTGRGVHLVGPCQGWCPVRYRGAAGWVHGRYLAAERVAARNIDRPSSPPPAERSARLGRSAKAIPPPRDEEPAAAAP